MHEGGAIENSRECLYLKKNFRKRHCREPLLKPPPPLEHIILELAAFWSSSGRALSQVALVVLCWLPEFIHSKRLPAVVVWFWKEPEVIWVPDSVNKWDENTLSYFMGQKLPRTFWADSGHGGSHKKPWKRTLGTASEGDEDDAGKRTQSKREAGEWDWAACLSG